MLCWNKKWFGKIKDLIFIKKSIIHLKYEIKLAKLLNKNLIIQMIFLYLRNQDILLLNKNPTKCKRRFDIYFEK